MEPWSWSYEEAGGVSGVCMDRQLDDSRRGRTTNHINHPLQILDLEIQQESPDFISTNHLASMKANLMILISGIV